MHPKKIDQSDFKKLADQNMQKSSVIDNFSIASEDFEGLNGWTEIAMQLLEAKNSLNISKKSKEFQDLTPQEELTLANGMFKNFILSYSKCFSSSGKHKISLDANDVFTKRQDLKEVHNSILETRNKYAAHNDDENGHDIAISYTKEGEDEIILAQTYSVIIPFGVFDSFYETINHCEEQVILKLNRKVDKLEQKIGKKINFK
jgi:hypothetical protein